MTELELADALREIAPFAGLSAEERARLDAWLDPVEVGAGRTVVAQGGGDRDLYVCLSGEAIVLRGGSRSSRSVPARGSASSA